MFHAPDIVYGLVCGVRIECTHRHCPVVDTVPHGSVGRTLEYYGEVDAFPLDSCVDGVLYFRIIRSEVYVVVVVEFAVFVHIREHIVSDTEIVRHADAVVLIILVDIGLAHLLVLDFPGVAETEEGVDRIAFTVAYVAVLDGGCSAEVYQFVTGEGERSSDGVGEILPDAVSPCDLAFMRSLHVIWPSYPHDLNFPSFTEGGLSPTMLG